MSLVDEATKQLRHATMVIGYIRDKYPHILNEALDNVSRETTKEFRFKEADPNCKKCDGKGWYMVANGPDDFDKEPCECVTNE